MRLSRPIASDMSSKQAIHSPAKGDGNLKGNNGGGSIKFNNQYVSELKRQSVKEVSGGQPLNSTILTDQNPQKFAQNMKQSESVALKEGRLDTSAAQFDTNELLDDKEREAYGEHIIEQPMENIDDISMAISHIKTPKKVSDMKSGRSGFGKSAKKKTQKLIQSESKYQYGKNTGLSSKKEAKQMTNSLSNEHFKNQKTSQELDLNDDNSNNDYLKDQKKISLGTKYLT